MRVVFMMVLVGVAASADPPFVPPPFNCSVPADVPPPTSVLNLHPSHVDVVMALGDSISAGFAMRGVFPADLLEYRGDVFSIGGDAKAYSLYNFIKTYNPDVVGGAVGTTIPLTKGKYLDAAVSGAKISQVPPQIDYLVATMHDKYSHVDFDNSWKLLTLFIGANDACPACTHQGGNITAQAIAYEENMRNVLTEIRAKIPRVFVNVITIFNISQVWSAGQHKAYVRICLFASLYFSHSLVRAVQGLYLQGDQERVRLHGEGGRPWPRQD